jgi:hypothetical protein
MRAYGGRSGVLEDGQRSYRFVLAARGFAGPACARATLLDTRGRGSYARLQAPFSVISPPRAGQWTLRAQRGL